MLDKVINNLLFEMHLPGYQYCGPRIKLKERLKRGDLEINLLDQAFKAHDMDYCNKTADRKVADIKLADEASHRFAAKESMMKSKCFRKVIQSAL